MQKRLLLVCLLNALSLFGSDYPGLSVMVSLPNLSEAHAAVAIAPAKVEAAIEKSFSSKGLMISDKLFDSYESFENEEVVFEKPIK